MIIPIESYIAKVQPVDVITTPVYVPEPAWSQAMVSVFLMDSPAVVAALSFFILLLVFEGKKS